MELIIAHDGTFYINCCGRAQGTTYNIIYQDELNRNLEADIELLLHGFEKSLSVYDPHSIISRINRNESIEADYYFATVFNRAKEISALTNGAFDPSGEPLFRLWGFSSEGRKEDVDPQDVDAVRTYIGMDKMELKDGRIIKQYEQSVLNFNAIAKGYSTDVVANLFDEKGIINYLIEIGGEIRVRGVNAEGGKWKIGIDLPSENGLMVGQELQSIVELSDCAIATSGNYRQFRIHNGQKIGHTIDPRTGCPTAHNLLSVTVVADDALTADAFATAFLVMGLQDTKILVDKHPSLAVLLIYDEGGEYKMWAND